MYERSIALCDGGSRRHLFAYDVEARVRYRLRVEDAEMQDTEKNWAAFEYQGQLHFVCEGNAAVVVWLFLTPSRILLLCCRCVRSAGGHPVRAGQRQRRH